MAITDDQAKNLKEQILKQVEERFPEDQKVQIKEYINSMDKNQFEKFLIENKMIKEGEEGENSENKDNQKENTSSTNSCVYCLIANKKIEAISLYEDKEYIAALEINPFSQGHTILIPKEHVKESKSLSKKAITLANKIGKQLVKTLKAEEIQILPSDDLGHAIVNIIPKYKDQKITFERKPTKKQELQELAIKIGKIEEKEEKPKEKKDRVEEKKVEEEKPKDTVIKLNRRIP
jgi:histidine triad (HIT) family protein